MTPKDVAESLEEGRSREEAIEGEERPVITGVTWREHRRT